MALQKRWAGCGEGEAVAQCRNSPRTTFDASSVYIAKSLGSSGARRVGPPRPTPARR